MNAEPEVPVASARTSEPSHVASQALLRAAALMAASSVLFGSMAVAIRLASAQLHPFEIAFFRNFFGLLFALPLILHHGRSLLRTDKLHFYFLRCVIGLFSMLAGFWAIVHLPLAQAISLAYSTPLFITVGAVMVLGEAVRIRRWSAVLIGFVGVLVIVRPGAESFSAGSLVALASAACSASVSISIKFLSRTEKPDAIVLFTTLIWAPLSLPPALFFWQWPHWNIWGWVMLAGFLGTAGHMCWTRALKLGDVSALSPISLLQLPVVSLFGFLLFGETLDRYTVLGAGIIIASNLYIAHREALQVRRGAPALAAIQTASVDSLGNPER